MALENLGRGMESLLGINVNYRHPWSVLESDRLSLVFLVAVSSALIQFEKGSFVDVQTHILEEQFVHTCALTPVVILPLRGIQTPIQGKGL